MHAVYLRWYPKVVPDNAETPWQVIYQGVSCGGGGIRTLLNPQVSVCFQGFGGGSLTWW